MAGPDDYYLRITAGTDYDPATHVVVPVNTPAPLRLHGRGADVALTVRVRDFARGLPRGSPPTSAYFDGGSATYSIAFWLVLKEEGRESDSVKPEDVQTAQTAHPDAHADARADAQSAQPAQSDNSPPPPPRRGISAHDLQWGNDCDRPLRDHLPPGFGTALRILKWWIDPGIDGDPYADKPFVYGPALSSFNTVYVGGGGSGPDAGLDRADTSLIAEGGDESGLACRRAAGCPDGAPPPNPSPGAARMKWALAAAAKDRWTWQYGVRYGFDFANGYLDFGALAVRLPGFRLPVLPFWDGQPLRYVLRHRTTGEVYLVVEFMLVPRSEADEADGPEGPPEHADGAGETEGGNGNGHEDRHRHDADATAAADATAPEQARRRPAVGASQADGQNQQPDPDDVD